MNIDKLHNDVDEHKSPVDMELPGGVQDGGLAGLADAAELVSESVTKSEEQRLESIINSTQSHDNDFWYL